MRCESCRDPIPFAKIDLIAEKIEIRRVARARFLAAYKCGSCGSHNHYYMLHDDTWSALGFGSRDLRCLDCANIAMHRALGRTIKLSDFTDAPVNDVVRWCWNRMDGAT